jgi:hypothetical protein
MCRHETLSCVGKNGVCGDDHHVGRGDGGVDKGVKRSVLLRIVLVEAGFSAAVRGTRHIKEWLHVDVADAGGEEGRLALAAVKFVSWRGNVKDGVMRQIRAMVVAWTRLTSSTKSLGVVMQRCMSYKANWGASVRVVMKLVGCRKCAMTIDMVHKALDERAWELCQKNAKGPSKLLLNGSFAIVAQRSIIRDVYFAVTCEGDGEVDGFVDVSLSTVQADGRPHSERSVRRRQREKVRRIAEHGGGFFVHVQARSRIVVAVGILRDSCGVRHGHRIVKIAQLKRSDGCLSRYSEYTQCHQQTPDSR